MTATYSAYNSFARIINDVQYFKLSASFNRVIFLDYAFKHMNTLKKSTFVWQNSYFTDINERILLDIK
jgi:hypothetical protein